MSYSTQEIGEQAYTGQYTKILELSYPARVKQGEEVEIVLKAEVLSQHNLPQLIIGIGYYDGPADVIYLYEVPLRRGTDHFITTSYEVGTVATYTTKFVAETPGVYRFKAIVGFRNHETYIDNTVEFSITVLSQAETVMETTTLIVSDVISLAMSIALVYIVVRLVIGTMGKLRR